jgi:hypothetical protein
MIMKRIAPASRLAPLEERPVLTRLKRVLRPLRPLLLPIWRRVRPLVEAERRPKPTKVVAVGPQPPGITSERPIRPIEKAEFDALARDFPYYKGRWGYMSVAGAAAGELIRGHGLRSALELGPHLRSVIVGADIMDKRANLELEAEGQLVLHDARETPWPLGDKQYDLFVALQVFEHLGTRQPDVFREVRRVARHAILSLPIDWEMDDPTNCHHRLSHEKVLSWFEPVVPTRVEVGNAGPRKRLVYVFEDLPA